jgi:tRNA dimethylallyltransferase
LNRENRRLELLVSRFPFLPGMKGVFFIVGPTAAGKSEVTAEVASHCGGEIVNADAFQIYRGLDLLTAKPEPATLAKARHHLLGTVSLSEEWNAAKFRTAALSAIGEIQARGRPVIVAGGSGLYLKGLTHGLVALPAANAELREELNQLSVDELVARLETLDPETARAIDRRNPRRLVRALEICLVSGEPASIQRTQWKGKGSAVFVAPAAVTAAATTTTAGVFVLRDRADLYERIDRRVHSIFKRGVVEEVRALGQIGITAAKTLGLHQIQELIAGKISEPDAIASIQQATRQYAKRQLTWFRRQTNFEPLNLSLQSLDEAVELISRKVRSSFAPRNV